MTKDRPDQGSERKPRRRTTDTLPVVIALVLGPIAEPAFHTSLDISRGSYAIFFTRPFSLILIVLIILGIGFPFIQTHRKRKAKMKQTP